MWPFYKILPDLPPPPQKFIDAVDIDPANLPTETPLHVVNWRHSVENGEEFLASVAVRTLISEEWEQWVRKNIVPKFNDTGICWRHCYHPHGGIHTDTTRDMSITWNIAQGGPKAGIIWYQEDDQPVMRTHNIQHLNYDTVTPVCELTPTPDNVWYIHDTRILHAAENLESPRIQFQISMNLEDIPKEWLVD
jgi:hypothetical protein